MTVADEQAARAKRTTQPIRGGGSPGYRASENEPDEPGAERGFDIGIASGGRPARVLGQSPSSDRRRLPVWVFVGLALLVGWLLGTLLGTSSSNTPTDIAENETLAADTPSPSPLPTSSRSTVRLLPLPGATLVLGTDASDDQGGSVMLVQADGSTTIRLQDRLANAGPSASTGSAVLGVGDAVLFIAAGEAYMVETAGGDSAVAITNAEALMAGTGTGNVWAIRPESQTVQLIDVGSRSVRATYDLSAVGTPLASYSGGLIVAPNIERFGPFALWSPARGIERIWSIDEQAVFVDAASETVVVQTTQGLASLNTVTGSLTQTERRLTDAQRDTAVVSPDGTSLAVREQPRDQMTPVTVIDLASGDEIDVFQVASPDVLRWIAHDQIVHLSATDVLQVQLRDTSFGFSTRLYVADSALSWLMLVD